MTVLTVYVPADPGKLFGILPGSAIVGSGQSQSFIAESGGATVGHVRIDYEGGRYGQEAFDRFETRLLHAADRHTWNNGQGYPTLARMWLPASDLKAVGEYDYAVGEYDYGRGLAGKLTVHDREALDAWIARYGEGR